MVSKRALIVDTIRVAFFGLGALILGFIGVSLLFSDLGRGETMTSRLITAVVFFLVTSFIVSYFNPRFWWLGGLVSWGGVLLGLGGLIHGPTIETLTYLLPSIAPTLVGAYLGGFMGRKWFIGRLFHRIFCRREPKI